MASMINKKIEKTEKQMKIKIFNLTIQVIYLIVFNEFIY